MNWLRCFFRKGNKFPKPYTVVGIDGSNYVVVSIQYDSRGRVTMYLQDESSFRDEALGDFR